ncbi:transcriptional regulator HexR [Arenibaculum sp.]|jgi:RpiR family carbohydrate utilization transcriptional regulator|uniref:transcriptional regulator HexR n=1 Tax=Arenibaculum sp. TaxID=2865862 RepID=UPI002E1213A6|nr:transcriptional regulator HexR [Arenibaculum sp.]
MHREGTLLARIRAGFPRLRKAEAKVAAAVLAEPEATIRSSLATLAAAAGVSEPTVIRFCRSLDLDGFPDFKIRLAQDLATGVPYVSPHVAAGDDAAACARKIFSSTIAAVQATAATLDAGALEAAVAALAAARRIVVFGMGGSAAVALDAYHKFVRLRFECQWASDPVIARMLLPAMGRGDVLLAASYTGRTSAVLDLARAARERGIGVLALAASGSPLARLADVPLPVPQAEDGDVFTPMAARIAMLALVDVLATGMALDRAPQSLEHLAEVKRSLRPTRVPEE